jgi:hypothetical protein
MCHCAWIDLPHHRLRHSFNLLLGFLHFSRWRLVDSQADLSGTRMRFLRQIPPAATLIFTMEIVKIRGSTVPKNMTFPEWSADELALWLDKDEAACQSWREDRSSKWEAGDAKLKESYPTREALDAWLDATCLGSKNKSLWKRTRIAKKKKPAASTGPAPMTKETARVLLTKVLETVKEPANKEKLEAIVKECEGGDPAQAPMMKMMKLMPAVQSMLGGVLVEAGYTANDLMTVAMQIKGFSGEDPSIAADTAALMAAMQGDVSALLK